MEHVQIIGCCFDMLECRTICCECFSMASTCIVVCPINDTNGGGVSWNNQAPHRKPWSSRSQNFPISCIQESTYYKIHVIPTLGYYNFIIWAAGVQASIRGTATWGPDKGDGLPKGCRQQHLRVSACLLSFICGIWKSCRHDLPSLKSKYQVNYRGEWLLDSTSYLIVPRPHWKIYPTVGYPSSARDMAPTPSGVTYCCSDDEQPSWIFLKNKNRNSPTVYLLVTLICNNLPRPWNWPKLSIQISGRLNDSWYCTRFLKFN